MKFNKLIPELAVKNISKSIDFYTRILGFKIEYMREEKRFCFLSYNGSQIMLDELKKDTTWSAGKLEYPFGRGVNFQMEVKDIQPILESLKNNKWSIKVEPKDNWYRKENKILGNREFLVMDPDGYLLRFAQYLGEKPVQPIDQNLFI